MFPVAKQGRRNAQQGEIMQTYQTLLRKLEDHEKSLKNVLATRQGRRLRAKRSVEEDEHDVANQDSPDGRSWSSDKIAYTVRARRYTSNDGVQSMSRRLKYHVVHGRTIDLDIQNCCLTLLQQTLAEIARQPPMPDNLFQLLDRLVKDRTAALKQLALHIVEGKEMNNTVLNGGNPPPALKNNEIVHGLQRISQYVRWVACNLLHNDYMSLAENKQKTFPSSTILSLLWTSIEDRILQSWAQHVLSHSSKPKHLSLHFDGIRISADHIGSSHDEFIKECENAIKMKTGFMAKIVPKKHSNFFDLVNALTNVSDLLHQPGNCIPCAFWHVVPLARPTVVAAMSDASSAKNLEAKNTRYRDYRKWRAALPGCPSRCFWNRRDIDGATVHKLNMTTLREIHCAAVDHATMISYWKKDPQDKSSGKSALLLDMVAGARDVPDESEEDASDDVAEARTADGTGRISFNEDDIPIFNDNIMDCLHQETNDLLNDLQKISVRCEGRRRCPLCPFRLVFDATGPKYVNVSNLGNTIQVRTASTRCHMAALESSNKLSSLLPRRSPHWMPMLEDIATSHEFSGKMESMITVLMQEDEWHYISMDATLKLCMKLMGQASYRSPRHVRDEAPFGDDIAWRRLLTVRGRTGAVLMMHPLQNESSEQLTDAMTQHFSVEQLRAVVHTGADSPAEKLFKQLKAICPSMQSLILDPINLAIVCEYGFWNRKSSGSKQLRRIFKKCISVDADLGRDYWGAFYDGTNARPLGEEEMKYRDMISSSSMTLAESDSILDGLEMEVPFTDRLEFIQSLRKSLWNGDDWTAWCSEQLSANLVRQHVVKKPALKRIHARRSAGVQAQRHG
ncbi:hypothetical protein AK812_SmicGene43577 [Symbiodinium microadriaticum]|uniref:Uncharacterized protein n=1 Tax=Symbiodinium microadriaticum TaxID=2951 RepID=A0A1Q9C0P6_SYMMI|nr:hypothetical protein AK812_SmicGene43577 [Symbiodinium microadriaticum]CAE7290966.1 unnamed protein product [Symbiodinium sp. KB8]